MKKYRKNLKKNCLISNFLAFDFLLTSWLLYFRNSKNHIDYKSYYSVVNAIELQICIKQLIWNIQFVKRWNFKIYHFSKSKYIENILEMMISKSKFSKNFEVLASGYSSKLYWKSRKEGCVLSYEDNFTSRELSNLALGRMGLIHRSQPLKKWYTVNGVYTLGVELWEIKKIVLILSLIFKIFDFKNSWAVKSCTQKK